MKTCLIWFLATLSCIHLAIAQKPLIDTSVLGKWPEILDPKISADGKFSSYIIEDGYSRFGKLNVVSNSGDWKMESSIIGRPQFSSDGRSILFIDSTECFEIFNLKAKSKKCFTHIGRFELSTDKKEVWAACLSTLDFHELN